MNTMIRMGAAALVATVAGCGGGGGGSDTVSLKSAADVAREVQNVSTLYAGGAPAAKAAGTGHRGVGVRGLVNRSAGGQARAGRSRSPAKSTTINCPDGGTWTYDDVFNQARALPLFAVSPNLDYSVNIDNDCRYVDGTYSEFYDGNYEYGDNYGYTAGSAEAPAYDYAADGSGSTPYRFIIQDTDFDEKVTFRTLGRYEGRDNGTSYQSREIFSLDFTYSFPGDSISLDIATGETGNPLIFVDNYNGDGTLSIDGPLAYSSSFCPGGQLVYDTVTNISLGYFDAYGSYYPNGGELHIQSGGAGVTLLFQSDGSVNYTFDAGGSGTVTLDQVFNADSCVFAP